MAKVVDDVQDAEPAASDRLSDTKSKLQRWFGLCGVAIGALAPTARLRPPVYGLLILLRGRSDTASSSSRASLRVSAEYAAVDIQTAFAQKTALSTDPADQYPLVAWMGAGKHADRSQPRRMPISGCIASLSWPGRIAASILAA